MSNMSYCRFENTFPDLKDCLDALKEGEKLSESEKKYAKKMLKEMADFLIETEIVTAEDPCVCIDDNLIEPRIDEILNGLS